ncbi:MAG: asparagine synthase (glutamine-hydrolyzing) [Waddliaceae bacterium]
MCGIAGIFDLKERSVERNDISKMTVCLKHRGPDGIGTFVDTCIALGHARLAVIDVEGGDQPIYNEDRSVVVVFNGEIYNFQEIREDLIQKGHHFSSQGDTEVIVHLYEEEGIDCLKRFRGMFAFALWDKRSQKLILARDIVGKKPLYYSLKNNRLIFGSEMKALLSVEDGGELNRSAVDHFLRHQFIPGKETIYQDIQSLPPAHYMLVDRNARETKRYWDQPLPAEGGSENESDYSEALRETLEEAVKIRLISDVPLGAFLSGGIDSSIIVGLMGNEKLNGLHTFSIGFKDESYDETPFANEVAHHFQTSHQHETLAYNLSDQLPDIVAHFDQPFGDSSSIPFYQLSKMTRKSVTVALSGDGSDEIFAGYQRYLARKLLSYYWTLPKGFRRQWIERLSECFKEGTSYYGKSFLKQVQLFVRFSRRLEENRNDLLPLTFVDRELDQLLQKDINTELKDNRKSQIHLLADRFSNLDELSQMMWVDFNSYLPDDILVKADRMSMAHGLEVRSPFLDQKVIELVLKMPIEMKLKRLKTKYILRKTFQNLLPSTILKRKKHGFMVPLGTLFKKELKHYIDQILLKPDPLGLFNPRYIEKLNREHQSGYRDHSQKLWLLLVFRLWEDKQYKNA